MPPRKSAVRRVDGKGRVTLPASFADATVLVEQSDANTVVIRRAVVTPVPAGDDGVLTESLPEAPEPNRALRRLMKPGRKR